MSTDFRIKYNGNVVPIEKVTLADGSDTVSVIHSSIDKVLSSSKEKSYGSVSTDIKYATTSLVYGVTTTKTLTSLFSILGSTVIRFIYTKIISEESNNPEVNLALTKTTNALKPVVLTGLGDFTIMPFQLTSDDIEFSVGVDDSATIEVLIGF